MNFFRKITILLLGLAYWYYSGQLQMGLSVYAMYFFASLIVYYCLKTSRSTAFHIFDLFFVIYGALVLLSHIELIHNPLEDYYVHNDASDSFYFSIVNYVLPCDWNELYTKTIGSPLFQAYPFAAFLFAFLAKIGVAIGIVNIRLYLRIHVFVLGALVLAFMSDILLIYKIDKIRVKKLLVFFGLFSYLFISSAIFSRDLHVCFLYTVAVYLMLKPQVRYRVVWFALIVFVSFGMRRVNGWLALIPPFVYYYDRIRKWVGSFGVLILIILYVGVFIFFSEFLSSSVDQVLDYRDYARSNTGGLFFRFYSLPFPLNWVIMVVYMLLEPLPIGYYIYGKGMTWLNVTSVFFPYLMVLVVCVGAYLVFHKGLKIDRMVKLTIASSFIVFALIVFGSPDLRRAFAAIPGLYMGYCLGEGMCPVGVKKTIKAIGWTMVFIIDVFFAAYVYLR